jgi:competence protein ComGC
MRKLNSRGLSLIATLVSIAIVSIMVLTVINLIGISGDVLNTFNNTLRAMDAAQEVRFAVADVHTCSLNLKDVNLTGTTQAAPAKLNRELTYPETSDKTKLSTRPVINLDNTEGEILSLDGIYLRGTTSPNLAYLEVRLRKKDAPATEPASHTRSLPIWVQTNPAGLITCCTSLNMASCP